MGAGRSPESSARGERLWQREKAAANAIGAVRKDNVATACEVADERGQASCTEQGESGELAESSPLVEACEVGPKLTPRFDRLGRIRRLSAEDGLASEHTTTACFSLFACALFLEVQGLSELRHPRLLRQLLEAVGPLDTERDFVGHLAVGPKEPPRPLH